MSSAIDCWLNRSNDKWGWTKQQTTLPFPPESAFFLFAATNTFIQSPCLNEYASLHCYVFYPHLYIRNFHNASIKLCVPSPDNFLVFPLSPLPVGDPSALIQERKIALMEKACNHVVLFNGSSTGLIIVKAFAEEEEEDGEAKLLLTPCSFLNRWSKRVYISPFSFSALAKRPWSATWFLPQKDFARDWFAHSNVGSLLTR